MDLCSLLREQGHTVCGIARNTTDCMEKVAECQPDLVMVDDDLRDGLSGLSLVETLAMSGFPAIIISGEPQSVAPTTSARAILPKPFSDAHLVSTMARVERGGRLAGKPCDGSLQGRRVLVVEDEYLIAEDLREQLLSCGAEVLGTVACVADALALLEDGPAPCGAILDIVLVEDETVYPVADALRTQGIPFVFATGYDGWSIPQAYADVPRTEKPVALRGSPLAR